MTDPVVVGIDLGSTSLKAYAATLDGRDLHLVHRPTPWYAPAPGQAEMRAEVLVERVAELLGELLATLGQRTGAVDVAAVGVAGMAETGVLVGADGSVDGPMLAWFDPRGGPELAAAPADFRAEFSRRTGLPVSAQAVAGKLLHRRAGGADLRGRTWLTAPELVAHALGGERVAEVSLAARTGLLDQDGGVPWPAALEVVGAGPDLLPPLVRAGAPCGDVSAEAGVGALRVALPGPLRGAALTVAGHDHLVAAAGAGAVDAGELYVSMGTAEALVRVLADQVPPDARERLADAGITAVPHVLRDRSVLLAGTRSGLLLRRVLALVGATDDGSRSWLDRAALALPVGVGPAAEGLEVAGAAGDDGVLRLAVGGDAVTPAVLLAAVLEHGNRVCAALLDAMAREVPPATRALVSGGWTRMESVRRARAAVLPPATWSARSEGTCHGAARFAAWATAGGPDAGPLPVFGEQK